MTDHTDLRDRIEDLLKDSTNTDWSTGEIDNALMLALDELSWAVPSRASGTIDGIADTWEYSISSLAGLLRVVEVWYPYLVADAVYSKPARVGWRMIDESTIIIDERLSPAATYDLRVIYERGQLLNGFDGATSTTLNAREQSALVLGAAGYAALALAVDKIDKVTIGSQASETLRLWGEARLAEFRQRLTDMAGVGGADVVRERVLVVDSAGAER